MFIWGKTDRIKRSQLVLNEANGGMNMVDIDSFLMSLKASWVTKVLTIEGEWKSILLYHLQKHSLSLDYVLRMNFRNIKSFPILRTIPLFYQEMFVAFNSIKSVKPISMMSNSEMLKQTIHGNELFKCTDTCIYMKSWIDSDVLYVKDLVNQRGNIMTDEELFHIISTKKDIMRDMYIIKNNVIRLLRKFDTSIAKHVHIVPRIEILANKKYHVIHDQKSKFFYEIMKEKCTTRSNMECRWSEMFKFDNTIVTWKNIYEQKIVYFRDNKLSEFNFKVLQNILPCGYNLSKWNCNINEKCEVCKNVETIEHMLYSCPRVRAIWEDISISANVNIHWKHLVCGYIMHDISDKIYYLNLMYSVIMYAIFKSNNISKFEDKNYANIDLKKSIKANLLYYKNVMLYSNEITESNWIDDMFKKVAENL